MKSILHSATIVLLVFTLTWATDAKAGWSDVGSPSVSTGAISSSRIVMDNTGTPYVAFGDADNSDKVTVMKYDGTNWGVLGAPGFSAGVVSYPAMAIDQNNVLYVAYYDGANGNKVTVMTFDGSNWVTVGTPGFSANAAGSVAITTDELNVPYVAYNEANLNVMKFDGTNWVTVGTPDFSAGPASDIDIKVSSGAPYVVYTDVANSSSSTVQMFDGSNWVVVGTTGFTPNTASYNTIGFGMGGTPYVSFSDGDIGGAASVMSFDGTNWSYVGTAGFSGGYSAYNRIGISSTGTPYVVYMDDINNSSPTIKKFNGGNWVTVGTAGISGGTGIYTDIAFDGSDNPYIVFEDYDNGFKAHVMYYSCTASSLVLSPSNSTICEQAGANFTVSANGTGLTYQWQVNAGSGYTNISNNATYSGVATTTLSLSTVASSFNSYLYRCNVSGECSATVSSDSAILSVNAKPNISADATDKTACISGNTTFSITASGTGLTYQWEENTGSGFSPLSNNATYSNVATNALTITGATVGMNSFKYHCVVTGTCSPSATSNDAILTVGNPTVTANASSTTICMGDQVTLNGGGASTYAWDHGVTDGVAFAPSGTMTYNVTGTDGNGCTATSSVLVTVNSLPTVTAGASSSTICSGDNVTLNGGGADTYSWDNGVTDGIAFAPSGTVTYNVIGTDLNSCTNSASISVTVNTLPTVTAGASSTAICSGDNVTLNGGGADTYAWDNGVTDGIAFAPSGTVTYNVIGTDLNSCTNSASISVTVNTLPTVTAGASSTAICSGDNVTLNGGGADTYAWDNGVTDGIAFAPSGTVTYNVIGTDLYGCTNSASISVTVNTLPTVTANASSTTVCQGDQIILNGGGADTYVWDNSAMDGVAFSPSGTTTFNVVGTDVNGCTGSDNIMITVNNLPTVTANASSTTVCEGDDVTLNGGGADTYMWDNGVTDGLPFTATSSNNMFTVIGTDINGCSSMANVTIVVNLLPNVTINSGTSTTCTGGGLVAISTSPSGGTLMGTGIAGNDFDPSVAGVGTWVITYSYTDGNNCSNSASTSIDVTVCSSISEILSGSQVNVYPNPSKGLVTVEAGMSGNTVMNLYNTQGAVVKQQTLTNKKNSVDLRSFSAGVYIMELRNDAGMSKQRIIIEK